MQELTMRRLDPEMKEGIILEWLKKEGDYVQKGDPIVKVEGEKIIFDIEVPESGVLAKILAKEGTSVPVGEPIAILTQQGEEISETVKVEEVQTEKEKASPAARKLAKEYSIDLTKIKGSGPEERIVREDVLKAVQEKSEISMLEVEKVIPLVGMRKTIAERLTSSYREAPHVAITMEVNVTETLKLQQILERAFNAKVPFTAILTKGVAEALKKYPNLNSTVEENQIKVFKNINIGIATAIEEGLIVPVVHNADKKDMAELVDTVKELIEKARKRELSAKELKDGTFTITNLGNLGVDVFTPIINPPQTAILGVGRIAEKPIILNGKIEILPVMTLSLVFDHRVTDGAKAAVFLQEIKNVLESPYNIFFKIS
jgi:pyruvate dehydrogenase E2 component (dihydrolipoamide acetyltransferase)